MTTVATPADLLGLVGAELGPTDWFEVTQERINLFADATGDQSHVSAGGTITGGVGGGIHVDVGRANAEAPFGGPIAHGYLTLSLVNLFLPDLVSVETFSMGVNVGLEKVRFPSLVPSETRIRGVGEVISAEEIKGGVQVVVRVTVEVEGSDRPACVADTVSRFLP